jgi:hypothetical protein
VGYNLQQGGSIDACMMATSGRLPLHHSDRILARDAKLLEREERLADGRGIARVKCKCRLCIRSVRSMKKREFVRKHLQDIGRHPYHRGRTAVSKPCTVCWSFILLTWSLNQHGIGRENIISDKCIIQGM